MRTGTLSAEAAGTQHASGGEPVQTIGPGSAKTVEAKRPSLVPREFVGRARDLRRRLEEADMKIEPAVRRVMSPIVRRLDRHPALRRDTLIDAERHWRSIVPAFGRLAMEVDGEDLRAPSQWRDCSRR